jgi:hypothetical protein
VRVNVNYITLCFCAILDYRILSLDAKVLYSISTSCNPIALCCCLAVMIIVFWWFGASRESAHHAHGHGSEVEHQQNFVRSEQRKVSGNASPMWCVGIVDARGQCSRILGAKNK